MPLITESIGVCVSIRSHSHVVSKMEPKSALTRGWLVALRKVRPRWPKISTYLCLVYTCGLEIVYTCTGNSARTKQTQPTTFVCMLILIHGTRVCYIWLGYAIFMTGLAFYLIFLRVVTVIYLRYSIGSPSLTPNRFCRWPERLRVSFWDKVIHPVA